MSSTAAALRTELRRPQCPSKKGVAAGALVSERLGAAHVVPIQLLHHGLRVTVRVFSNWCDTTLLG
jgi:hypothetical protein